MEIGIVTRHFPPYVRGGSHLSVYYLAEGLLRAGMEVHVFTSHPPSTKNGSFMDIDLDIHDHRIFNSQIPANMLERDMMSLKMMFQLRRKLRDLELHFDVLHSYGMDTIPAVLFNRRHSRVVVASANENWATCPFTDHSFQGEFCLKCSLRGLWRCTFAKSSGGFARKALAVPYIHTSMVVKKFIAKKLDLLMPISYHSQQLLMLNDFDVEKMRVCYVMLKPLNYEELGKKHYLHDLFGLRPSTRIILYAGRFAEYKGVEYIIRAIPKVVQKEDDVVFMFAGHGTGKEEIQRLSEELKIEDKVMIVPFIDAKKMPLAYASSYCVVYPCTLPEPFGRVPMEAAASGTPVITTKMVGASESIEEGFLVKPFSSTAISEALIKLLTDEKMRDRIARGGMEKVLEKHGIDNQIKNYVDAYKSILEGDKCLNL